MKSYLVGAFVILLALLAVLLWPRADPRAPLAPTSPALTNEDAGAAGAGMSQPAPATGGAAPTQRQPVDVAAPTATLRGRVVRAEDHAPLAGGVVRLRGHPQGPAWLEQHLPLDEFFTFEPADFGDAAPVRTGPDGTFAFTLAPPRGNWFELRFEADGRIPAETRFESLAPGTSEDLGDVAMARGCAVHGVVVDTRGEPQPGVELSLTHGSSPPVARDARLQSVGHATTSSGHAGTFVFAQAFLPGAWKLQTRNRQKLEPFSVVIQKNQTDADLRIVVSRPEDVECISGRVVDEAGAGLAEAQVTSRTDTTDPMWATIAADGGFRLERRVQDPRGPFELTAWASGRESQRQTAVGWGARGLLFVLRKGLGVTLVVRHAGTGEPVERFGVRKAGGQMALPIEHRGFHARGELELTGLRRGRHAVIVVPMDHGLSPSAITPFQLADGPLTVDVRLHAPEDRTVQVRRPDGSPVVGSRAELLEPGKLPVTPGTFAARFDASVAAGRDLSIAARLLAEGTTDAAGDAILQGPPEPRLTVRVSGPGHRAAVLADLRWSSIEGPLRVEVEAGATLAGRLLPEDTIRDYWQAVGREPSDAEAIEPWTRLRAPHLELSRTLHGRHESWPPFALGRAIVARDGTFTITGIPPGTWRVTLAHRIAGSGQSRRMYLGTVSDLRDGETRRFDASLGPDVPAMLHGTVLVDGQPLSHGSIHLRGAREVGEGIVTVKADGGGGFAVQLDAGTWRMAVALAVYGQQLPVEGEFTVEPGQELHKRFQLRTGSLQLRIVRDDGTTPVSGVPVLVELPGAGSWRWLPPTDAAGNTTLDRLPLQTVRLSCRPAHLAGEEAWNSWLNAHGVTWREAVVDLGVVEVRAPTEVKDLVLPATAGY